MYRLKTRMPFIYPDHGPKILQERFYNIKDTTKKDIRIRECLSDHHHVFFITSGEKKDIPLFSLYRRFPWRPKMYGFQTLLKRDLEIYSPLKTYPPEIKKDRDTVLLNSTKNEYRVMSLVEAPLTPDMFEDPEGVGELCSYGDVYCVSRNKRCSLVFKCITHDHDFEDRGPYLLEVARISPSVDTADNIAKIMAVSETRGFLKSNPITEQLLETPW